MNLEIDETEKKNLSNNFFSLIKGTKAPWQFILQRKRITDPKGEALKRIRKQRKKKSRLENEQGKTFMILLVCQKSVLRLHVHSQ